MQAKKWQDALQKLSAPGETTARWVRVLMHEVSFTIRRTMQRPRLWTPLPEHLTASGHHDPDSLMLLRNLANRLSCNDQRAVLEPEPHKLAVPCENCQEELGRSSTVHGRQGTDG